LLSGILELSPLFSFANHGWPIVSMSCLLDFVIEERSTLFFDLVDLELEAGFEELEMRYPSLWRASICRCCSSCLDFGDDDDSFFWRWVNCSRRRCSGFNCSLSIFSIWTFGD
jgi:hypothetical protein